MGAANAKLRNDSAQPVHVRTHNNADRIYSICYHTYTINAGETVRIEAAADAWGLQAKICFEGEEYSRAQFMKNGSTHNVSAILPLHTLRIENKTDKKVDFVVTDRQQNNTTRAIAAKDAYNMTSLLRGPVSVSVISGGIATNVLQTNSNGKAVWDGTNLSPS